MKKILMLAVMAAGAAVVVRAQPQMTPTDNPTVSAQSAQKEDKGKDAKASDKGAASTAPASAGAVKVEKIVVSSGIDKRDPTGEGTSFSGGPVYCWTKLAVTNPPAKVKYVWTMGSEKSDEIEKDITTAGRWWTTKQNVEAGSWKCEVVSEGGESLGSVSFTVSAAAPKADAGKADAPAPAKK